MDKYCDAKVVLTGMGLGVCQLGASITRLLSSLVVNDIEECHLRFVIMDSRFQVPALPFVGWLLLRL